MARRLLVVENRVVIRGRGLVLFPGVIPEDDERFSAGNRIVLRRPDGSSTDTQIDSLEIPSPNPRRELLIFLKERTKEDVPVGTEVWSTDG